MNTNSKAMPFGIALLQVKRAKAFALIEDLLLVGNECLLKRAVGTDIRKVFFAFCIGLGKFGEIFLYPFHPLRAP